MSSSRDSHLLTPSSAALGRSPSSARRRLHYKYTSKKQMSVVQEESPQDEQDQPELSRRFTSSSIKIEPPVINVISASHSPRNGPSLYQEFDKKPEKTQIAGYSPYSANNLYGDYKETARRTEEPKMTFSPSVTSRTTDFVHHSNEEKRGANISNYRHTYSSRNHNSAQSTNDRNTEKLPTETSASSTLNNSYSYYGRHDTKERDKSTHDAYDKNQTDEVTKPLIPQSSYTGNDYHQRYTKRVNKFDDYQPKSTVLTYNQIEPANTTSYHPTVTSDIPNRTITTKTDFNMIQSNPVEHTTFYKPEEGFPRLSELYSTARTTSYVPYSTVGTLSDRYKTDKTVPVSFSTDRSSSMLYSTEKISPNSHKTQTPPSIPYSNEITTSIPSSTERPSSVLYSTRPTPSSLHKTDRTSLYSTYSAEKTPSVPYSTEITNPVSYSSSRISNLPNISQSSLTAPYIAKTPSTTSSHYISSQYASAHSNYIPDSHIQPKHGSSYSTSPFSTHLSQRKILLEPRTNATMILTTGGTDDNSTKKPVTVGAGNSQATSTSQHFGSVTKIPSALQKTDQSIPQKVVDKETNVANSKVLLQSKSIVTPKPQSLNSQLAANHPTHRSRTLNVSYSSFQRKAIEEAQQLVQKAVEKNATKVTKNIEEAQYERKNKLKFGENASDEEVEVEKFVERIKQRIKDKRDFDSKNEMGALAGRQNETKIAKNVREVMSAEVVGEQEEVKNEHQDQLIIDPVEKDIFLENNNCEDSIQSKLTDENPERDEFYNDEYYEETDVKIDLQNEDNKQSQMENHVLNSETNEFVESIVDDLFNSLDKEDFINHAVSCRLLALQSNEQYYNFDEYAEEPISNLELSPSAVEFFTPRNSTE